MDRKSKAVIWTVFILILVSAYFLYDRYLVQKDFEIFTTEDGIPIIEE